MREWPKDALIGIAQPLTWPYIHSWTHLSMMGMDRPDITILDTPRGGDIAEKREAQTKAAIQLGCTHIAYLDADMVYPRSALWDMMEIIEDGLAEMCGIVCYRGAPPHDPLIWGKEEDRLLTPFKDYQFGELVDAGAVGCACLMVKTEALKLVDPPYFQICEIKDNEKVIRRGEDTYFTKKMTSAGARLKVITAYDIGHIREMLIDRHVWLMGMIMAKLKTPERVIQLLKQLEKEEKENGKSFDG